MFFLRFVTGFAISLFAGDIARPGKLLFIESTKGRYVELRESRPNRFIIKSGYVESRPELKDLMEVHGDIYFICTEIHGVENPRIVIESTNKKYYQVIYKWGDREALKIIAKPLNLLVTREIREIPAITIRVARGGHRLEPAKKAKHSNVEETCRAVQGRWLLEGVTADELARFLEIRYRRPVINLTDLKGRWSLLLSQQVVRMRPFGDEKIQLDDLGLELQLERVSIPVTVIKDKPTKK